MMVCEYLRAAEKSGEHDLAAGRMPLHALHQVIRHDAEQQPQFEYVPALVSKDGDARIVARHGIALPRNRLDQRRFAAAVGAEYGDVLLGHDPQAEIVQCKFLSAHHSNFLKIDQGRFQSGYLRVRGWLLDFIGTLDLYHRAARFRELREGLMALLKHCLTRVAH